MSIGQISRRLLGNNFKYVGQFYRSIFVNLDAVAKSIHPHIPHGLTIIDIGGGSGHLLNHLFSIQADLDIKMLDLSSNVGEAIQKEYLGQVEIHPSTSMAKYSLADDGKPVVALISDVLHHIPVSARKAFFNDLKNLINNHPGSKIIIKDVQPGYFRSWLGYFADRYISGDKNVSLVEKNDVVNMIQESFDADLSVYETNLFEIDRPNYALVFTLN